MERVKEILRRLYADQSKHSNYQSIPEFVARELNYKEKIDERWRGDKRRLQYVLAKRRPRPGELWGDFGANTGFFSLSLAHKYPKTNFIAIEANDSHARFINTVINTFNLWNLQVLDRCIGVSQINDLPKLNCLLHFNVLHHAGCDYDREFVPKVGAFYGYATTYLREIKKKANELIFQMGSNWCGNKNTPIVETNADGEKLLAFSRILVDSGWNILTVAYPVRSSNGGIRYRDLQPSTRPESHEEELAISRDISRQFDLDSLPGEFNRRPLFYCESN